MSRDSSILLKRLRQAFAIASFGAAVLVLSSSACGAAEPGTLPWYEQNTEVVLSNARKAIEPTLPEDQREIAQSIEYRVTGSPGIGAFAAYEDGQRVIVIAAGTVQVFDWIYEAMAIEQELHRPGCYKEYITYLSGVISENQHRVANHLSLKPAMPPFPYAAANSGACSGATFAELAQIPDYGSDKARAIEASIMFLYLHELGHHVLGHTDGRNAYVPRTLAMSRAQEDLADRFAISTALNARYMLVSAVPWNAFVAAFGGDSIEAEIKSDHPLGLRRVLTIYAMTIEYYTEHPDAWPEAATYNRVLGNLKREREELKRQLDDLPQ